MPRSPKTSSYVSNREAASHFRCAARKDPDRIAFVYLVSYVFFHDNGEAKPVIDSYLDHSHAVAAADAKIAEPHRYGNVQVQACTVQR